jgi:acetyl esterase/lipase
MKTEVMNLWDNTPGLCEEIPTLTAYLPDQKAHNSAVVIFPGGGYHHRAKHEGEGYAEFLVEHGYTAFVCAYRVAPHRHPLPLLDARRAVRLVRHLSKRYGIDQDKIAVMGSSAGGHLAALISTYTKPLLFENQDKIDREDYLPNAQILCYPVIKLLGRGISHLGSGKMLLDDKQAELGEELSPDNLVTEQTPPAFIWHTFDDTSVNVINSLDYLRALRLRGIAAEGHFYPNGAHGLGLAQGNPHTNPHVSDWSRCMLNWLDYIGF